jgi:hypothetical protein
LVDWYYRVSPGADKVIENDYVAKVVVRSVLLPAIGFGYLCLKVWVFPALLMLMILGIIVGMGTVKIYSDRKMR